MKVFEVTEGEIIRGKTASRDVGYDPNYKGLQNYDGKHLMNDADAIEALLYGRGFSQEEDAFRDLLIRKYKITRETDIGALLKSIRDQLEAKNRQHIKDRDAENAKYDDEGNLIGETTTASGSIAVAVKPVGKMQSRTMYNTDGTMKNALDGDKLMAGKKKPKKNKQA